MIRAEEKNNLPDEIKKILISDTYFTQRRKEKNTQRSQRHI